MNMSRVISHIMTSMRLADITLPFKDPDTKQPKRTETIIQEVIQTVTIPIYSVYQPWMRKSVVSSNSLKCIDKKFGIYMLPAELCNTKIIYVSDVRPYTQYGNNGIYYGGTNLYQAANYIAQAQSTSMLVGQMRSSPTFEDLGDFKVGLHNFGSEYIEFIVASTHLPNIESIEEGCYASFLQLCILDIKMFLYNTLKSYEELPTAYGTIKINLESYQGAESERSALLEKWDDVFHLDMDWEEFI